MTVEEKRSDEPVTFNEWCTSRVRARGEKVSAGGRSLFAEQSAIVRVLSQPVEIVAERSGVHDEHKDRPGMVATSDLMSNMA